MGECEQVCLYVGRCGVWVNVSNPYVCRCGVWVNVSKYVCM